MRRADNYAYNIKSEKDSVNENPNYSDNRQRKVNNEKTKNKDGTDFSVPPL